MNADDTSSPLILLFDGPCGLCDAAINFVRERAPAGRFQYLPQQSPEARELLTRVGLDPDANETVVLIDGDRVYTKSTAALRIALELAEPWPLLGILVYVPASLRDAAYDFVAKHRHQWFKPPDACQIS